MHNMVVVSEVGEASAAADALPPGRHAAASRPTGCRLAGLEAQLPPAHTLGVRMKSPTDSMVFVSEVGATSAAADTLWNFTHLATGTWAQIAAHICHSAVFHVEACYTRGE